jgi:hypothetical protein
MKWISEYNSYFRKGDIIKSNRVIASKEFIIKDENKGKVLVVGEDIVGFDMDGERVVELLESKQWVNISKINREKITLWKNIK